MLELGMWFSSREQPCKALSPSPTTTSRHEHVYAQRETTAKFYKKNELLFNSIIINKWKVNLSSKLYSSFTM